MRHGEAVDLGARSDAERWLTPKGRRDTRAIARWLAETDPPAALVTSPLVRAVQTAEIVMSACGLETSTVFRELSLGDLPAVIQFTREFHGVGPLCLVGHEPTLSEAIAELLGLRSAPVVAKSSIFALDRDARGAMRLAWQHRPGATPPPLPRRQP